jgi:multidrug efflux pump subunit AcrB
MIDFAIEERRHGANLHDAIFKGRLMRFRPIMMTMVAALAGTLPIALGYGEGGDARQPLVLAVVGRTGGFAVSDALYYAGDLCVYERSCSRGGWEKERWR